MCGRYALGLRATFVRHQLQDHAMPVDEAPEDDDVRQTYNFAPGYHGLVYRADVPDYGAGARREGHEDTHESEDSPPVAYGGNIRYKLQAMKWGLVPFWTKRNPDYGTVMKTINARDDSLIENRGMWNTMKQKKRCVVVAQGFYEWLKKNGGKEKIPHYVKRKDDQLMCFAGLWDCVQYEGSDEKLYTYTIITTDSNKQLKFLHDRMPVILNNGSDQIRTWLDPHRSEWSKELQSLLKPFDGELECYPVSKEVGKVGNNSPTFIIPVASAENKNNIANFFSTGKSPIGKNKAESKEGEDETRLSGTPRNVKQEDDRPTIDVQRTEDNAPMPVPVPETSPSGLKRKNGEDTFSPEAEHIVKAPKLELSSPKQADSPSKHAQEGQRRKTRSATSNGTALKASPSKASDGSQRITNFFNK